MLIRYFVLISVLADSKMMSIMSTDYFRTMSIALIFVSIVSDAGRPTVSTRILLWECLTGGELVTNKLVSAC